MRYQRSFSDAVLVSIKNKHKRRALTACSSRGHHEPSCAMRAQPRKRVACERTAARIDASQSRQGRKQARQRICRNFARVNVRDAKEREGAQL